MKVVEAELAFVFGKTCLRDSALFCETSDGQPW